MHVYTMHTHTYRTQSGIQDLEGGGGGGDTNSIIIHWWLLKNILVPFSVKGGGGGGNCPPGSTTDHDNAHTYIMAVTGRKRKLV